MKTYTELKAERDTQMWEGDFRWSVQDYARAIEAFKKANALQDQIMAMPAKNIERSFKQVQKGAGR